MGAKKDAKRAKAEAKARAEALSRAKAIAEDARAKKRKKKEKKGTGARTPSEPRLSGPSRDWDLDPRSALAVGPDFDLATVARDATPGWSGGRKAAEKALASRAEDFSDLQERLYASSKGGGRDCVLLIIQGLDTAGKGGIVRHVVGQVDPQGVALTAFKAPTEEERAHDFLWRVRPRLPRPGMIGVFDRSHYEDLLVPTAAALSGESSRFSADEDELNRRYHDIYDMEVEAIRSGTRVIKICLVISYEEQGARLLERLERPDKHWKFSMGDLDTRDRWDAYQRAYTEVISRTSTRMAPWYVVPADHKWYARLAVQEILVRALEEIDPKWPAADFDVEEAKRRLDAQRSPESLHAHRNERLAAQAVPESASASTIVLEPLGPIGI